VTGSCHYHVWPQMGHFFLILRLFVANFVQKNDLRFLDEDLTKSNSCRSMNI